MSCDCKHCLAQAEKNRQHSVLLKREPLVQEVIRLAIELPSVVGRAERMTHKGKTCHAASKLAASEANS